jgi:hypothetical protein
VKPKNVGQASSSPSTPHPNPAKEWKKAKLKTEDLLALVNSGFLREKEIDLWSAATGDPYPMEKNPDEIPMFAQFMEQGLALPASEFCKGMLRYYGIEYQNLNANNIFHVSVIVHFSKAFVGIKPHWILFRKFFRLKPQLSTNDPRVVEVPASKCVKTLPSSRTRTGRLSGSTSATTIRNYRSRVGTNQSTCRGGIRSPLCRRIFNYPSH